LFGYDRKQHDFDRELIAAATEAGLVHQQFTEQQIQTTQLESDLTRWVSRPSQKASRAYRNMFKDHTSLQFVGYALRYK